MAQKLYSPEEFEKIAKVGMVVRGLDSSGHNFDREGANVTSINGSTIGFNGCEHEFREARGYIVLSPEVFDDEDGPQPPVIREATYTDGITVTEEEVTVDGTTFKRTDLKKLIARYQDALRRPLGNVVDKPAKKTVKKSTKK